jgi:hypothetical protein
MRARTGPLATGIAVLSPLERRATRMGGRLPAFTSLSI